MRIVIASLCLILSVLSGLTAEERDTRVTEAETVAQQYLTAFFHSDLRTAASLTHPETLQQLKSTFGQERAAAVAAGKEAEFLAQFGMAASTDLDALNPTDLYVAVAGGLRRSQPEVVAAMKAALITVKDSKRTGDEGAVVTLVITAPAATGTQTQDARLSLALVGGQWRVTGNAQ